MPLGALVFSEIVEEEDQVEKSGNLVFAESFQVAYRRILFPLENFIKNRDAVQDVYVRGKTMVKIVLYLAGQPSELGYEASEHP